ncbi:MAG: hypothetical protein HY706_22450 [Candidatus Hydrogenedentes bacterium]|nr:hypothetical protein [Candidatus Hydrogenedentota bacterium]
MVTRVESIESAERASLQSFYLRQEQRAELTVAVVREQLRLHVLRLEAEITKLREAQTRLSERAVQGEITPDQANRTNRELIGRIGHFLRNVEEARRVLQTDDPRAIGGFVDLPLDAYGSRLLELRPARAKLALLAYILPPVMSLSVFLPWLEFDGQGRSLYGIVDLLNSVGIATESTPIPLALVWLFYALLPLIVWPVMFLRDRLNVSWGLLLTGAAAVCGVCAPMAALAVNPTNPLPPTEWLLGVRLGAFVYVIGGFGLVVLGLKHTRLEASPRMRTVRQLQKAATAAIVLMVLGLIALALMPGKMSLRTESEGLDPAGLIRLTLRNTGVAPINVYVPWPEGVARRPAGAGTMTTYGIALYVQERGRPEFRLLRSDSECWLYLGAPVRAETLVSIGPGLRADIKLDTACLRQSGIEAEAVRLSVTRSDGTLAGEFEMRLPAGR